MENNNYPENRNSLPRRGFLSLLALGAGAGLLSACQKALETLVPTPSRTSSPTATGTATLSPTSTSTPTPTETATVTPTPTPVVRAEPWERKREDKEKTLAQMMFPFVGGINHINRQGIDLRYENLNIAIVQDKPFNPSGNLAGLREEYARQLNQSPKLLQELASISVQLEGTKNVTPVIRNGEITQVIKKPFDTITRYVLESNATLREMSADEEPQLMPDLYVDGTEFKRVDTGETIKLTGAVDVSIVFKRYSDFKLQAERIKNLGGNFVNVQWNSGYIGETSYIPKLIDAINYYKQVGLRVQLTLLTRGLKPGSTWEGQWVPVDQNIINDWKNLLSSKLSDGSSVASLLGKSVDIFTPLGEPKFRKAGSEAWENSVSFYEWKIIGEETGLIIRDMIRNPQKIISISTIEWAGDPRAAVGYMPEISNVDLEIHPYQWIYEVINGKGSGDRSGEGIYERSIKRIMSNGIPVLIGECGFRDSGNFQKKLYEFFKANSISFAYFASDILNPTVSDYFDGEDETT